MEVLGDDWNILELHWTTCKFLLGFSPFFATGRVCKGTAIKSEFHWQLLFDLLPIAAEFRPVCDEQSESLLCPQTDALLSAQFQLHGTLCSTCICFVLFFFFWKWGLPKICKIVLFLIVFWTMPLNELPDFVPPASCQDHQKHEWVWAGQAWCTNEPTKSVCCRIHSFSEGWSFWSPNDAASVELSDDVWHQVEHGHDEAQCQDCSCSCFRTRSSYDIVILKFMIMTYNYCNVNPGLINP